MLGRSTLVVSLGLVLGLAACRRGDEGATVRVITPGGNSRDVTLEASDSGEKRGRGYVDLERLGAGAQVQLSGKAKHQAKTAQFPGTYRLFLTRDGRLQLVRYTGEGEAPAPGAKSGGHDGKRHRDLWQTLDEDVRELRFD